MKRLSLIALILLSAALPSYARSKFQGYAERGGQTVLTSLAGSTVSAQRSFPACPFTVYLTGTATLATIYSDNAGTIKPNPSSADSAGLWSFFADDAVYDIKFSPSSSPAWTIVGVSFSGAAGIAGLTEVASFATAGTGSSSSPWTGWDTAITWSVNTAYHFRSGFYNYATSPNFGKSGIRLLGDGLASTILHCTGPGNAFVLDSGGDTAYINGITLSDLSINGNVATTNGVYIRGLAFSSVSRITVQNAATLMSVQSSVQDTFDAVLLNRLILGPLTITQTPTVGLFVSRTTGIFSSVSNKWSNLDIEYVNGIGLVLDWSDQNTFINLVSENNVQGMYLKEQSVQAVLKNHFIAPHFENNSSGIDAQIDGPYNIFDDISSGGTVNVNDKMLGQGAANTFRGGIFTNLNVGSVASYGIGNFATFNNLHNVTVNGTFTDAGVLNQTMTWNCVGGGCPRTQVAGQLSVSGPGPSVGALTGVTGAVAINFGTDLAGIVVITPNATTSATGTFTISFQSTFPAVPSCSLTLRDGTGTWNGQAGAPKISALTATSLTASFSNNAVNLVNGSTYMVSYQCIGMHP